MRGANHAALATLAGIALALRPAGAAAGEWRPWAGFAEAPAVYWLLVLLVAGVLAGFIAWLQFARQVDPEHKSSTGRYHALGALVLVMSIFTLALYLAVAERVSREPATARAWDWAPGEVLEDPGGSGMTGEPWRGYQVYLAQGCTYCHTLYVRPQDVKTGWAVGATEADVSQPGDFANYPYTLLGTQRNGPDLTIIGRRISDMSYHVDHLREPRKFKPRSIMPSYDYLPEQDLRDLAAYMVSLDHGGAAAAPAPAATPGPDADLVKRGKQIYSQQACVGCHTLDGSRSVGPSFKGLLGNTVRHADGSSTVADAEYVKRSITHPQEKIVEGYPPVMPQTYTDMPEADLEALVALIESLDGAGN